MSLENTLKANEIYEKMCEPLDIKEYSKREWNMLGLWALETAKWPVQAPIIIYKSFTGQYAKNNGNEATMIEGLKLFAPILLPAALYQIIKHPYNTCKINNKTALKSKPESEFDVAILPDWNAQGNIKNFDELYFLFKDGVIVSKDQITNDMMSDVISDRYKTAKYFTKVDPALKKKLDKYLKRSM